MSSRTALTRYLIAATLARSADAGAPVGFVLLAGTVPGLHRPELVGALLVTCLMLPHLLGPLAGRRLDRSRDGRRLIAAVCVGYAVLIGAATLTLGHAPLALVLGLAALAGAGGPLLTGGLSSRLAALSPPDEHAQRRAQGLDSLSYGIGGTGGTALVASLAALTGPRVALLALAFTTLVAAALIRGLPPGEKAVPADLVLPLRSALGLFTAPGPLRRVMGTMLVVAFPNGAVAVIAVALADDLDVSAGTAGLLTAVFGLGYLIGSLILIAWPLPGEPERSVAVTVAVVSIFFACCAVAPNYVVASVAFFLLGASNAPYFTATLAARSRYSPPGARAQVFVTMAALKVGSSAAGSAAAGVAIGLGPRPLLAAGAAMILAAAIGMTLERRYHRPVVTPDSGACFDMTKK
ncbi:MFS transporter [Kineosporia sp. NBRC 101677]|uniref:MFS transporter n=1 Tax=Kineosporia sp. NBRC 101677 TaxID=3032197 RepID=UPI0024A1A1B4|nr:MFS transporter [Kineosporia sp. NBRC 101677]GLY15178.1 MFS transporter [Kineosporia sp. NBRC 101677]